MFHQRVINRNFFDRGIFLRENFVQLRGVLRGGEPPLARLVHFRLMLLQPFRDRHERPDEHAGVPAVVAAVHVFERLVQVRFLHETLGTEERGLVSLHALRRRQRLARLNVAVARGRLVRLDAF